MNTEKFTAWVQAALSVLYLTGTFVVIIIYELGYAKLPTAGQEKSFDNLSNWLTGGALVILYFWFQRAKTQSAPDPQTTTTKTETITTPSPAVIHSTTEVSAPPKGAP